MGMPMGGLPIGPPPPIAGMPDPMGAVGSAPPLDGIIDLIKSILGTGLEIPEPKYPRWYKKPPKPDQNEIWSRGITQKARYRLVHDRMHDDILWIRGAQVGLFEEDIQAMRDGLYIDKWRSMNLINEWNLACAFMAGLPWSLDVPRGTSEERERSRRLKATVNYLRTQEVKKHAESGQGHLPMDEARMLTLYGMIVNRTVVDIDDPEFPFDSSLIDPATIYPEWHGKRGLGRLWRVYKTTYARLVGDFGEIPKKELKKIKATIKGSLDDDTEIEVVEYWDTWYRAVIAQDAVIVPVTEHKYGYVPYTIQYGPLGEPMSILAPASGARRTRSGEYVMDEGSLEDDLPHKSLSYIGHMKVPHMQYEALMARMLTGMKKAINPPLLRERDEMAAEQPMPEMDTGPGAINETMLGHERVSPIPTSPNPMDMQILMQAVQNDQMKGMAPPSLYGLNDRSNVSGTAINALSDAGMDKIGPWVACLEQYHTRRFAQWFMSWRNFGHLAKYVEEEPQPFIIPLEKPEEKESAFELTPEIIDESNASVEVTLTKVRRTEWIPLLNAGKMAYDLGVMTKRQIAQEIGQLDYDEIAEEVIEDKMLDAAIQHPKFAEMFGIPNMFKDEVAESKGDPEKAANLQAMLDAWMQIVAAPPQPEPQQPSGPMDPMAMMGGGMQPNNAAGISFNDLGQGPGSMGGGMGGPPPIDPMMLPNSNGFPGNEP
jgi:hypothetical protein